MEVRLSGFWLWFGRTLDKAEENSSGLKFYFCKMGMSHL
jgi:hypothetical protein